MTIKETRCSMAVVSHSPFCSEPARHGCRPDTNGNQCCFQNLANQRLGSNAATTWPPPEIPSSSSPAKLSLARHSLPPLSRQTRLHQSSLRHQTQHTQFLKLDHGTATFSYRQHCYTGICHTRTRHTQCLKQKSLSPISPSETKPPRLHPPKHNNASKQ